LKLLTTAAAISRDRHMLNLAASNRMRAVSSGMSLGFTVMFFLETVLGNKKAGRD
jgi:hypothetical protein